MNIAAAETPKAQKFESARPELLIGHAPGTMEAIAIKIVTVLAFYEIVWYHPHLPKLRGEADSGVRAAFARSWLAFPKNLGRLQQDAGALRRSIGGTRFLSE